MLTHERARADEAMRRHSGVHTARAEHQTEPQLGRRGARHGRRRSPQTARQRTVRRPRAHAPTCARNVCVVHAYAHRRSALTARKDALLRARSRARATASHSCRKATLTSCEVGRRTWTRRGGRGSGGRADVHRSVSRARARGVDRAACQQRQALRGALRADAQEGALSHALARSRTVPHADAGRGGRAAGRGRGRIARAPWSCRACRE